jgi:uncharacterized protein (DUF4415 family)
MNKHLPLIDDDGEVRELTAEDMREFRPAAEVLPPALLAGLVALKKQRGERGPQKSPTKVPTTIRFDADVLAELKASGKGWQTRVNEVVKDWLKKHHPA